MRVSMVFVFFFLSFSNVCRLRLPRLAFIGFFFHLIFTVRRNSLCTFVLLKCTVLSAFSLLIPVLILLCALFVTGDEGEEPSAGEAHREG